MRSPAASVRGGAVGAVTAASAVAAHGIADGGYPSGAALILLLFVAVGVGAAVTVPRFDSDAARFTSVLGGLALGQLVAHAALAVGSPHGGGSSPGSSAALLHTHTVLPSPAMIGAHAAASVVAAVLVCNAEWLYGPITSIVRAILEPPLPVPDSPAYLVATSRRRFAPVLTRLTSLSRRGPPARAIAR